MGQGTVVAREDFEDLLVDCGEIEDIFIPTNNRGFGFVTFTTAEDADYVIRRWNYEDWKGRELKIQLATGGRRG